MTPEQQAAWEWYGDLRVTEVLICPVCGTGVAPVSDSALLHKRWHEQRGEA
ncbi:hypothetical protein [Nocardioides halotolerans]|jgi:hypothetical protein|uniref:hypothetical protein n=1 Tax=Nocardioides halotolerans TaxID=433660 RepID=UPI00041E4884|nr:hypothetical protein [Nocardioides halotolerans]